MPKHGLSVTDCYDEDWGWEIEFEHAGFPLRLGCGNMDEEAGAGEAAAFCCFITPSRATLRPLKRLFRAVDTRPAVARIRKSATLNGKTNRQPESPPSRFNFVEARGFQAAA